MAVQASFANAAAMNFREMQQQVENSVGQSIDSAESMHRMAAASAFEQLGQVAPIASLVQSVRPLYENGAGQLFEWGRTVNRSGGEIARALLDRIGM